jgi:hypothetical protein
MESYPRAALERAMCYEKADIPVATNSEAVLESVAASDYFAADELTGKTGEVSSTRQIGPPS